MGLSKTNSGPEHLCAGGISLTKESTYPKVQFSEHEVVHWHGYISGVATQAIADTAARATGTPAILSIVVVTRSKPIRIGKHGDVAVRSGIAITEGTLNPVGAHPLSCVACGISNGDETQVEEGGSDESNVVGSAVANGAADVHIQRCSPGNHAYII